VSHETQHRAGPFAPMTRGAARAVVVLFILSFLLSGAAYWFSVRAVQGEIRNRATVTQLCETGNEARAQQVTLWTHLVQISAPPPHQTPAQARQRAAQIASFLAYVRTVFAPRDCGG
jgi:hypothetical protein